MNPHLAPRDDPVPGVDRLERRPHGPVLAEHGGKVTDLNSERELIRIQQGKGRKDRYAMLSAGLLDLLRAW